MLLLLSLLACDLPEPEVCRDPAVYEQAAFTITLPGQTRPGNGLPILPSDYYLEDLGHRYQVSLPTTELPAGLGDAEGFGPFTPILIPFTAPVDPATLDDQVLLFRFDQGEAEPLPFVLQYSEEEHLAYLVPDPLLPEGAHVAVAVRTGVQSAQGLSLQPSAAYRCLVDGWPKADLALLSEGVHQALEVLGEQDLAWVNTFRVTAPHARLQALADAVQTPPGQLDAVLRATDEDGRLTNEVLARMPSDRQSRGPYPALHTLAHGRYTVPDLTPVLDLDGDRPAGDDQDVPFTLLLPELSDGGEHPLVLYLHGIASCRETALRLSDRLNAAGWIVAAPDHRQHYTRYAPDETRCGAVAYTFAFLDLSDLQSIDERVALNAADVLAFRLWLQDNLPDLLDDLAAEQGLSQAPTLGQIHLVGESLGGIIGTSTASTLPADAGSFVSVVSGGGLVLIALQGLDADLVDHPVPEADLQWFIEAMTAMDLADPLSHAAHIQVDTLLQEAHDDQTMPNATTELWAWTAGVPIAEPRVWEVSYLDTEPTPLSANRDGQRTLGLSQFEPATHQLMHSGIQGDRDASVRQLHHFLETSIIEDPYTLED